MDPWLIAQCMARLPRLTYFSHPESSLDDFFCGEARTMADGSHWGDCSSSTQQGVAPHEHEFLRSLNQSLGIHPLVTDDRVVEFDSRSRGYISDFVSRHPSAPADELLTNRLLQSPSDGDCFSLADPTKARSLPSGPTSILTVSSPSMLADMHAAASSSSLQHMVSYRTDLHIPTRLRVTTNVSDIPPRHQCHWEVAEGHPCGEWIGGGSREVWLHVRAVHGLKGLYSCWCNCRWGGCSEKLKVSSLQRHIAKHLGIKWRCSSCDMVFARYDYARRHMKLSEECHSTDAVTPSISEQTTGTGQAEAGTAGSNRMVVSKH